jgi:urease accessory protein
LVILYFRSNVSTQTRPPLQGVKGYLKLCFAYDPQSQLTSLSSCEQTPPLRVVHAFAQAHGSTLLHLHNLSGGVLGGDQLGLDVEVGEDARVQLTTTSATRLYRCRAEAPPARQQCHVHIQSGGLLEYLPDQLIPFAGSRYQQATHIELAEDAGLFWWETLAPGRLARGESFAYDLLELETEITANGLPIACERFKLEPQRMNLSSPVRLGGYLYHSSFFICRVGLPAVRWLKLEQELTELALQLTRSDEIIWGVSTLVAHGLIIRAASQRGYAIAPGLLAFWQAAKRAIYGEEAIPPRKIY